MGQNLKKQQDHTNEQLNLEKILFCFSLLQSNLILKVVNILASCTDLPCTSCLRDSERFFSF